jgi:subfamily B ATP-binding cassette protein MsbA
MRRLNRLLRYVRPYWFYLLASVISMALVGLFDAFRLLLIGPIFDRVLNPAAQGNNLPLIRVPLSHRTIELGWFVPEHFHNVWTIVAFALVASTVLKGIFDYVGTYLVNYAGFGMITDLRNHLYEATLRRSSSFFHKHATGTILSTSFIPRLCGARLPSSRNTLPARCSRPLSMMSSGCSLPCRVCWPSSCSSFLLSSSPGWS